MVDQTDEGEVITILPNTLPWQKSALAIWLIIWVFTGLLAFVGSLKELGSEEWGFLLVFLCFWAYFLFYGLRSLIWNRSGAEYLRLTGDSLDYKRSWNGFGKVKSYDLQTIKELGVVDYSDKKFAKTYNDVFWTVGGEMIGFSYIGHKVAVGFKLDEEQAKQVVRTIQKAQKTA